MELLFQIIKKNILFICFFLCGMIAETSAQLVLSEIDPSSEFIEVYNDCENFVCENENISEFTWSELTSAGIEKKYIMSSVDISAGDFFVFEMSRKINNTGDTIAIYENTNRVSEIQVPALKSGKTYQKNFETGEWSWEIATKGEANTLSVTPTATATPTSTSTPTATPIATSTPTPTPTVSPIPTAPVNIFISEILPNPEGTDGDDNEFIELYNAENTAVDISGYVLEDASGKKYTFPENTHIEALQYKAFYKRDTRIVLNNSNESVFLWNPSLLKISTLSFTGSAPSGKSYSVVENKEYFTEIITPNAENKIPLVPISTNTETEEEKIKENFTLFPRAYREKYKTQKIHQSELQLLISKISISGKPDFIEVQCVNCNATTAQLAGVMLSVDGVAYQIPNTDMVKNIKTGDILRFEFYKNTEENIMKYKEAYFSFKNTTTYIFPVFGKSSSGLVTSDEVIAFGNLKGEILDAMCYANMSANGKLISSEKKDLGFVILQNQWSGELKEWGCVNSAMLTKDTIFVRKTKNGILHDTNTKDDFLRERTTSSLDTQEVKQFENIDAIKISRIQLSQKEITIDITNTSSKPVSLNSWYITNHQKFFYDIRQSKGDKTENFLLYPNQFLTISINSSAKKYAKENLFLSIHNSSGEIADVFCVNKAKDAKGVKKAITTTALWRDKNLWQKQRKENVCFEYRKYKSVAVFTRRIFSRPANISQYIFTEKLEQKAEEKLEKSEEKSEKSEKLEEKQHVENLCITFLQQPNGFSLEGDISACLQSQKNPIALASDERVKKVRIYIVEKKSKLETRVSHGKFIFNINKPLQKGEYTLLIRFFTQKKSEKSKKTYIKYAIETEKFTVKNDILPSEFGNMFLSRVLPNPKGRDKGEEKIMLKNSESFPHWSRNWTLNGKKLPSFFLEQNQEFLLQNFYTPSLKNKKSEAVLRNSWGEIVSVIRWEKARNNEWFGLNATKYVTKTKKQKKIKKTKTKTKTKKYKTKKTKKKLTFKRNETFTGIIEKIIYVPNYTKNKKILAYIHIENSSSFDTHPNIRNKKYIFYEIPSYLPDIKNTFSVGKKVEIFVSSGVVKNVTVLKNKPDISSKILDKNLYNTVNSESVMFFFFVLFLISFGGLMWGAVKIRK